ncbi:MAG: sugar ABC transporter substrate-binding protein [Firmicutes bacterium]|nr:sugar ABC transporter substrate-binding protein [Bacillota bacterium]
MTGTKKMLLLPLALLCCSMPAFAPLAQAGPGPVYSAITARFTGEIEPNATVMVLENDTAIELGYVEQLIAAFNEAYKDQGIKAERLNTDQYADLATDGPYGYGPDVWYQANDIIMKYAQAQHILPVPYEALDAKDQIPPSAWEAYAINLQGETLYCGVPVNVQSGMLYYIESMLPEHWQADWDVNANGVPDFFETYTALYALSADIKENGGKTEYGYLDDLIDTYFMGGYLFTYGAYIFGDHDTDPSDIGLGAGEAFKGARMIRQWAKEMDNTEVVEKAFASAAFSYLATGRMLCTITTPDVRRMFIREMAANGWTAEEAERDLKMINVPCLPVSGDLTADGWRDTILRMDELTIPTRMMGGINGYGISAYTKCPNASLAFVEFATSYAQVMLRNAMLGIIPARADAAAAVGETDDTVRILFDKLDRDLIDIMPAIQAVGQLWTPWESFLVDITTDALRENRGEAAAFGTDEQLQAGLNRLVQQLHDAIFTLQ